MQKKGSDENYFYSIAYEFLSRTKRSYFLSPLEIDLILKWEEKKIPLSVIKKALKEGFKRAGRKKTLLYFKKIVEKEFKNYLSLSSGKNMKTAKGDNQKREEHKKLIEIIPDEYFKELYAEFFSEERTFDEKVKFDEMIDKKISERFFTDRILEEAEIEWSKKYPFISVDNNTKRKLVEKYLIVKKREELNLFSVMNL